MLVWLGRDKQPGRYFLIGWAVLLFLVSFSIRALHAVDLSPVIYTKQQPGGGMSLEYERAAQSIMNGNGLLQSRNWDPADTSLLGRAPGYPVFLSAIYSSGATSYFYVQVIQNLINSVAPVLIFLIGGLLITYRVGLVAGLLASVSHHLSYYSNLVLPDATAALPILLAVYILVRARRSKRKLAVYALVGLLFGLAAWLRPNLLLIGPFIGIVLVVVSTSRPREMRRAWLVALLPFLVVAPITIRNYIIFHSFVMISENMGIVLWEGIGDAGGARFGAPTSDGAVALQESVIYDDSRYAQSWSTPDGITRDRDRIKKSIAVIIKHPLWFARAMGGRMQRMVSYVAEADLIQRVQPQLPTEESQQEEPSNPEKAARRRQNAAEHKIASQRTLAFGEAISPVRPAARFFQRIAKETSEPFIFLGFGLLMTLAPRRALILFAVPAYFLIVQSTMHLEFRYTLPMHYFLFIFAAAVWVLIGSAMWSVARKLYGSWSLQAK